MVEPIFQPKNGGNLSPHLALAVQDVKAANSTITDSILQLLAQQRETILSLAAQHGASNVRIFGSLARHEAHAGSDIDFLMDIEPGRSLLNRIALIQALEDLLGRKVDVAKPENLHESIREQVLTEAIPL